MLSVGEQPSNTGSGRLIWILAGYSHGQYLGRHARGASGLGHRCILWRGCVGSQSIQLHGDIIIVAPGNFREDSPRGVEYWI